MTSSGPSTPAITVIGDGLAGSLLSLALARRGVTVELLGSSEGRATDLSYGSLPRGRASWEWNRLRRLHGPLGWQPTGLVWHDQRPGLPAALAALSQTFPLPIARVDPLTWGAARRQALTAAGVCHRIGQVRGLRRRESSGSWQLDWESLPGAVPTTLEARSVVLAAGAASRTLWPSLPARLRHSWAGVLLVGADGPANPWLDHARRGRIVQPRHWLRPSLEASAATLTQPTWIVDVGVAPQGEGVVVGQISLIPMGTADASGKGYLEPPDPRWMETRLREGLRELDPELGRLEAAYRQVPVSFCVDGQPLMGPIADAPGLWAFTGFSGAFACVPPLAEGLANELWTSLRGRER